jgi:predicted nucleic acid-binding protein
LPDVLADTYALFAAVDGARAYRRYFLRSSVATTALNVVEFAFGLLRRGQAAKLGELLPPFLDLVVEPGRAVVEEAARFKRDRLLAGANCSYVDAWGYATSRSLGVPFLTGDEDFRGVPGVRFVKA